jgi:hypothetical protein
MSFSIVERAGFVGLARSATCCVAPFARLSMWTLQCDCRSLAALTLSVRP